MPKMTLPILTKKDSGGNDRPLNQQHGRIAWSTGTGKNRRTIIMKPGDTLDVPDHIATANADKLIPATE